MTVIKVEISLIDTLQIVSPPQNISSQLTQSTQDVAKKEDKKTGKLDSPSTTNAGGEVKATCPQCGQTFRRKFNMTIHIDRVETVYPYLSHLNL